jgi:uncharacterized protein YukE
MDGAVTPEQWARILSNIGAELNKMAPAGIPVDEGTASRRALRRLRDGLDVGVYDPGQRPRLHYAFGPRCVRSDINCPCILRGREAGVACPPRYRERDDRLAARILVVDDDWNGGSSVEAFTSNVGLWHQRVESWRGAVRILAFALLCDQPDGAEAAQEVADSLFDGLRGAGCNLSSEVFFAARPFWDLCAQTTISLSQDFCGRAALVQLEPDLIVERMLQLQAELNGQAQERRYIYGYPLAVTITKEEAGIAKMKLLEHVNQLLRGQSRGAEESESPGSSSEECA